MNKTLKITSGKILFVLIILLFNQAVFSEPDILNGDLGICRKTGYNISAIMEASSVPFEGITYPKSEYYSYNRVDQIQNGVYWRFYINYPVLKRNIAYISGIDENTGNDNAFLDFGHCSGHEYPQENINVSWGFAKYKITYIAQQVSYPHNSYTFKFYLNSLDSKYQDDISQGGYGADLYIAFEPTNEENIPRIRFYKMYPGEQTIGYIYTTDVINGEPTKEYRVWEVVPQNPVNPTKNFNAKTTPFPICPRLINSQHIRVLELGTEVTLNGVYQYTGESDKLGYNTIDSLNAWSYNYYSNPPIEPGANLTGKTYVTPATYYEEETDAKIFGFRLNVKNENKISIVNDHRLWISGYNNAGTYYGDTICFSPGSQLVLESLAQLNACRGGKIIDSSATINWNPNAFMHIYQNSEIAFCLNNNIVNNGGHIEVDRFGTFKVCDNSTLTFDGAGTYLKLNPNAIVQLGQNAKIEFKNGAYINADGAIFSGINSAVWSGIVLENSGADAITNCTFNNANTPIKITNTVSSGAYSNKILKNNHFNYPASNCVFGENIKVLLFEGNTINMNSSNIGLLIKNYYQILPEHESQSSFDNVIIKNNVFNNGGISMALACYTSGYTHFFVQNNTFNGSNVNINFVGRLMGGSIKENHSEISPTANRCLQFTQANPDLYGNNISSGTLNIYNSASYPNMAPQLSGNNFVWTGGRNQISCTQEDNIYFDGGIANLDYGENCFYRQDISKYHLIGFVNSTNNEYNVRNNGFNNSPNPAASMIDAVNSNPVVIFPGTSNYICNTTASGESWIVRDKGNGVYDSIMVTTNNEETEPSADETLYGLAEQNKDSDNYTQAIDYFITLINNYPSSSNLNTSLYDLYSCYEGLDTSGTQSHRNIIFGYLKSFLDNKILSGLYSDEFNDIAYNITIMCLANMTEYEDAKSGYEFISLYHPDPYLRLLASWDYAEIENLILGAGGESSKDELMSDERYIKRLEIKLKGLIPKDPVLDKVKKSYDKKKKEKYDKAEKEFNNALNNKDEIAEKLANLKSEEQKINSKVVIVLRSANKMSAEDRNRIQNEDLVLPSMSKNDNQKQVSNIIPEKYDLSQNYPNPFNPVTKINFSIPKSGFVTLKVYDITGREIKVLVNEVKQSGNYTVDFNGAGFASGVYFYRIQSSDFTSVKRMVLVK